MAFDLELWRRREGQSIGADYVLERCVAGDEDGAVFETTFEGRPAVIELAAGRAAGVAARVESWGQAGTLSHPGLVAIYASGHTMLGERRCGFVVRERAEENLAEVLAERHLSEEEMREMLGPVLGALRYLHAQGFAHGEIRAANVMAAGEQVKISSDRLIRGGSAAADRRAIGALIKEAMAAGPDGKRPEPFETILRRSEAGAGIAELEALLRGDAVPVKRTGTWAIGLGLAAAMAGAIAFWPSGKPAEVQKPVAPEPVAEVIREVKAPEPMKAEAKKAEPKKADRIPAPKVTALGPPDGGAVMERPVQPATVAGITQVMPEIPAAARNTISGKVRINVRVQVDNAGNVSQATLLPPGASKYFTDRVVAAARAWKFPAGNGQQVWVLPFDLSRTGTRVTPMRTGN
jgi:TonB family protein